MLKLLNESNGGGLIQLFCIKRRIPCHREECKELPVRLVVSTRDVRGVCRHHTLETIMEIGPYELVDIATQAALMEIANHLTRLPRLVVTHTPIEASGEIAR